MSSWPLTEQSLARTYQSSYDDAYESILDYRRVQSYRQTHPDASNYHVSKALELPRGRVRAWMDGAKPDALSAVKRAEELDWFDADATDPSDPLLGAFVRLLAGIYAGGSIRTSGWTPHWTSDGPIDEIRRSLRTLGIEYRRIHIHDSQRATELVPSSDGSLLGRSLFVLGAPIEDKNKSSVDQLPEYLFELPHLIQRTFVYIYLTYRQSGNQRTISIQENRSKSYHNSLADLITEVVTDSNSVTVGENGIYVSASAREELSL
ncbi:hypothetical protein [Haloplanus rubicundus]|uniref:Uncharacterized protein n=1 Tax=Haloplanus rubicundus TaxID=1547898 RepID=A0A345E8X2_9EURY|nr:hypothetical protein [Haloplanus rubicundus]AXG08644.1 hypothetical protein DU484_01560 [Haloplanus rubicundus]